MKVNKVETIGGQITGYEVNKETTINYLRITESEYLEALTGNTWKNPYKPV